MISETIPKDTDPGHSVDPRAVHIWRWNIVAFSMALLMISAVGLIVFISNYPELWPLAAAAFVCLAVALTITLLHYPGAYYRHLRYWVDENGIRIQKGIFWRKYASLPRVRIQHSDVSQGPLQRYYGIATLKLYTAGSQHTQIELDGLEYHLAVNLRNQLQLNEPADAV